MGSVEFDRGTGTSHFMVLSSIRDPKVFFRTEKNITDELFAAGIKDGRTSWRRISAGGIVAKNSKHSY